MARLLGEADTMTARELGERGGFSPGKARRVLSQLVASGRARRFKDGRSQRYFASHTGARPDLGLGPRVAVVRPRIAEGRVNQLAAELRRSSLLGLIGEDEEYAGARLLYRPVYQVEFDERVKRSLLERLVGPSHDHLIGTTYHHASTLQVLLYTPRRGIEFSGDPGQLASRIEDFDGAAGFDDVAPAELDLDTDAWQRRRSRAEVEAYFRDRFAATPGKISAVFVPLWQITMQQAQRGNYRLVLLDALVGRPVDWPA